MRREGKLPQTKILKNFSSEAWCDRTDLIYCNFQENILFEYLNCSSWVACPPSPGETLGTLF